MRKTFYFLLVLFTFSFLVFHLPVRADEYDELGKKIEELKQALQMSQAATTPLEATLKKLEGDIADIRQRIANLEGELKKKEQEVAEGEKALEVQQKILESRVRSLYKKNSLQPEAYSLQLLFSKNLSETIRLIGYQKSLVDEDKKIITEVVLYIKDLEEKKSKLQAEKIRLASAKEEIDKQAEFFRKEIKGAREYQATLAKQIAELTLRQKELLAQKLASLNIPRSAGTRARGCSDDRSIDPGFSQRFAFFTFGAPHRVGLNQYGAKGRAEVGQKYEEILRAYYNFDSLQKIDTNIKIKVQGYGEFSIEDYVLRIYEMPPDWPVEALKAQAIAARSFALAYTNNGAGEICTTESCQVFQPEPNNRDNWPQAVKATEGLVAFQGGGAIKAWYASTHGGYSFNSGEVWGNSTSWTKHITDTPSGLTGSFADLHNSAYDKSSPWFYCDWGARTQYKKTAWLKSEEVADIVNVILLARADSETRERLYQTDKPHPFAGEIWNEERVKTELKNRRITPYNSVSDLSVQADFNAGKTTSVNVSGDADPVSFSGQEFKDWFNLRAPANIQIVGPLFNIEKNR